MQRDPSKVIVFKHAWFALENPCVVYREMKAFAGFDHAEESTDLRLDAEFFLKLALEALLGSFARLDVSHLEIPRVHPMSRLLVVVRSGIRPCVR